MIFRGQIAGSVLGGVIGLTTPFPVTADQPSDAEFLAKTFAGFCAQNVGRSDKVQAAARVFGFEELTGDKKAMLAPQDPNAVFTGWIVEEEGNPDYLLGVSDARSKGRRISICSVANPTTDMDAIINALQGLLEFGEQLDEYTQAGQRVRVWSTENLASKSYVTVIDAPKMETTGGSIALTAPKEE